MILFALEFCGLKSIRFSVGSPCFDAIREVVDVVGRRVVF